jgi:predicted metal-dependent HD superfamily phosphohydrolase
MSDESLPVSIASVWRDVSARYDEPHRQYHSRVHLDHVLATVDELLAVHPVEDPDTVRLAALFHDAIYDPVSSTNELDSADLAAEMLGGTIAAERIDRIQRLVLATIDHWPASIDEAVLLDADLAPLAVEPTSYFRTGAKVRAEYSHVDDDAWAEGRQRVIRSFLDRPWIYSMSTMAPLEVRARSNMAAEFERLTSRS